MKELPLWQEVQADLQEVEAELLRQVDAPDPVLSQAARHLVQAGGKRLRPAFAILAAKCCGAPLERVLPLAVALEMIHMATLVHDDVIDASPIRRGRPTVWARWGQELSLHTGDYLFARSLLLVATYDDPRIPSILASTSVKMVQGELHQLAGAFDLEVTLRDYLRRIYRKTALLIAASCQLGAIAAGAREDFIRHLYHYGRNLGMAFQITDDVLDMVADPERLGKPIGSDLRQGVITLPAIYAIRFSPKKQKLVCLLAKRDKTAMEIQEVIDLIKNCGGIDYALGLAERYLARARQHALFLPEGRARETLMGLTHFVRTRGI
ncbi:MAG: heptaprenyl diphosphate synthase component 2 [Moorella sp. (in: firmicutes)]|jgi:heptaprenyl diphosphate synthase|uniref:polyprenyl synthetase family protein n=1 Tax=Moorella sp. E308F TaxID=2572682 RepID=UPI0010FFB652|nr:polyprenyl synthetase family protein [Moorella sp. E308F]MDK2816783.1 heptaprenyl diphosphate synthase component 2 [Moorella sp. (in: firmicutes)]MDK2893971.1 heptaprenyl diphosphate synthase component 2 [Moorella sp. (in: firmicutes)]GEA15674.1 heptaprenyl diphosphate synthase subunit II [Moorella sp. E308F]